MKVNFWQVLGLVLIIVGVVMFARGRIGRDTKPADPPRPAATSPAATMGGAATAPTAP